MTLVSDKKEEAMEIGFFVIPEGEEEVRMNSFLAIANVVPGKQMTIQKAICVRSTPLVISFLNTLFGGLDEAAHQFVGEPALDTAVKKAKSKRSSKKTTMIIKACARCGASFEPTGNRQIFCDNCSGRVKKLPPTEEDAIDIAWVQDGTGDRLTDRNLRQLIKSGVYCIGIQFKSLINGKMFEVAFDNDHYTLRPVEED